MLIGFTHDDRVIHLLTSTDSKLLLKMLDDTTQDNTRSKFYKSLVLTLKMETILYGSEGDVL